MDRTSRVALALVFLLACGAVWKLAASRSPAVSAPALEGASDPARPAGTGDALRVGIPAACGGGLFVLAKARELFEHEGVDVDLMQFPTGRRALDSLLDGELDLAVVGDVPLAVSTLEGRPLRVISAVSRDTFDRWIVARPTIHTLGELRGKRVGVQKGTGTDYILDTLLSGSGMASGDVVRIEVPIPDLARSLASGRVDAFVVSHGYSRSVHDQMGLDAAELTGDRPFTVRFVLAARATLVGESADRVIRALRALTAASDLWAADPAGATRDVAGRLLVERSKTARDCQSQSFELALDRALAESMQNEWAWFQAHDPKARTPPALSAIFEASPLRTVRPQAVTYDK